MRRLGGTCPTLVRSVLWVCDPILHFRTNPDLVVNGRPINARGFRGEEFGPRTPGIYRVVALGDSCTFGFLL